MGRQILAQALYDDGLGVYNPASIQVSGLADVYLSGLDNIYPLNSMLGSVYHSTSPGESISYTSDTTAPPSKDYKGIIDPVYGSGSGRLQRYSDEVLEAVGKYLKEELGISVGNFGKVKVSFGDFGSGYEIKKDGKIARAKIFGLYDSIKDEIILDKSLGPDYQEEGEEIDGYNKPSLQRVLAEEYIHFIQNKLGIMKDAKNKLGSKARDYLEGSAASIADSIFGETDAYPVEKRKFRDYAERVGSQREAVLTAPCDI